MALHQSLSVTLHIHPRPYVKLGRRQKSKAFLLFQLLQMWLTCENLRSIPGHRSWGTQSNGFWQPQGCPAAVPASPPQPWPCSWSRWLPLHRIERPYRTPDLLTGFLDWSWTCRTTKLSARAGHKPSWQVPWVDLEPAEPQSAMQKLGNGQIRGRNTHTFWHGNEKPSIKPGCSARDGRELWARWMTAWLGDDPENARGSTMGQHDQGVSQGDDPGNDSITRGWSTLPGLGSHSTIVKLIDKSRQQIGNTYITLPTAKLNLPPCNGAMLNTPTTAGNLQARIIISSNYSYTAMVLCSTYPQLQQTWSQGPSAAATTLLWCRDAQHRLLWRDKTCPPST